MGHTGGAAAVGEDVRPESGARAVTSACRRESGIETADASQDSDHNDKQQLNIDVVDIKSTSHHVSINRKRRESQSLFLKAKKMPSDKFECIPIKVWNGLAMDGVKVQQLQPVKNTTSSPRGAFGNKARTTLGAEGFPKIFKN